MNERAAVEQCNKNSRRTGTSDSTRMMMQKKRGISLCKAGPANNLNLHVNLPKCLLI